jgi:hypothetical protein
MGHSIPIWYFRQRHAPSVRLLLAIAVQHGRTVGQFNVSKAFQQGIFLAGEVIYMCACPLYQVGVYENCLHRCTD